MKTFLWSKVIEKAYNIKVLKQMYRDFLQNVKVDDFLEKYLEKDIGKADIKVEKEAFYREKEKLGFDIISIFDDDYPDLLKKSIEPPPAFYYIGEKSLLSKKLIAVVGSRKAPNKYLSKAKNLGYGFNKMGLNGVSGLALGIDASFQKCCSRSVGVIGCGIDVIYPKANLELYEKIKSSGVLISEFPLGTKPLPFHFPRRNRIISGLAEIIVVVYAMPKSGALITLDFALDEGKDIFLSSFLLNEDIAPGYSLKQLKKHLEHFN